MATIDLGRLGFVNKGTYNNSTTYEKNDLVQFTDGGILSTYLYIDSTAQSGQAPSSSGTAGSRWVYYAKGGPAGADGTDVAAVLNNNEIAFKTNAGALDGLAIGSAGQALKVNSGANGYEFGSAGGIAQLVHTNYASGQTHSSSNWTNLTGVNATLTPASTSNKVYINAGIHGQFPNSNSGWKIKLQRIIGGSGTDVWEENDQKGTYGGSSGLSLRSPVAYLDSPNTTSAVTYQFMVYTDGNSTVNFNTNAPSYVTIMEVTV